MVLVKIKENKKEARALLEYLRSLSFVEVVNEIPSKTESNKLNEIAEKINTSVVKRMKKAHNLDS